MAKFKCKKHFIIVFFIVIFVLSSFLFHIFSSRIERSIKYNNIKDLDAIIRDKSGEMLNVKFGIYGSKNKSFNVLHIACMYGHKDMVDYLLNKGMNINALTSDKLLTPLSIAILDNDKELVWFLIKRGANVNEKNIYKESPLFIASQLGNISTSIIEILLKNGANVNEKDISGESPLFMASRMFQGSGDIIKMLIENGADARQLAPSGSCLDAALFHFNYKSLCSLLKYGNFSEEYKSRSLYFACGLNNYLFAKKLLMCGADPNYIYRPQRAYYDQRHIPVPSWTPLSAAIEHDNSDLKKLLIDYGAKK